jgi:hypothetical protein
MTLKDSKMSKQGPTGKRINITSTILQELEIIRRLKSGKKQKLWHHMMQRELSDTKKQKDQ